MNVAGIGSVTGNERLLFRKVVITSLYCLCRLNVYHSYGRKNYHVMMLAYLYSSFPF